LQRFLRWGNLADHISFGLLLPNMLHDEPSELLPSARGFRGHFPDREAPAVVVLPAGTLNCIKPPIVRDHGRFVTFADNEVARDNER
jgi:hypothetical protein